MKRYSIIFLIVLLASLDWGAAVLAHAEFKKAEPASNSTMKVSPKVVKIWFTQELDPKGSRISVLDAARKQVDDGKGGVDLDDMDRMTLIAKLKPLSPGVYTVKWRVVSAEDKDVGEGSFRFTVVPPATSAR